MHYYEYFKWLCKCAGVDEPTAYKGCGLNRSSVSRWRKAMEEGREVRPSGKAAAGIAAYFHIPADSVFTMTDVYGLSPNDYEWMGTVYQTERTLRGISIDRAVDGEVVTADELSAFEEKGTPLSESQLVIISGLIGADPTFIFSPWKDRLWGETKKAAKSGGNKKEDISDEAHHVGVLYDRADEKDKLLTHSVLDKYEEGEKITAISTKQRNPGKMIEFDVFDEPAAAGLGNYLDAPQSRREQFPAFMVPNGADFCIRISGNSMEPRITDGTTVFVKHSVTIESGRVGIFVLNGSAYCKQLIVDREKKEVRLHSFNPDYADIVVTAADDLRTIGQVL